MAAGHAGAVHCTVCGVAEETAWLCINRASLFEKVARIGYYIVARGRAGWRARLVDRDRIGAATCGSAVAKKSGMTVCRPPKGR